jgi:hypothetical protein
VRQREVVRQKGELQIMKRNLVLFAILLTIPSLSATSLAGQSVVVTANPLWTDTGITISAGEVVAISASGTWSWDGNEAIGPDGDPTGEPHFDDFQHFGNGDKGRLIGFIGLDPFQGHWGDGEYFPQLYGYLSVGSTLTFVAGVSGELWLGFNDDAVSKAISDNSGSVLADISFLTVSSVPLTWARVKALYRVTTRMHD